ncbi:hypothetical protein [Hymenobacter metallilatus]|uniref:Uncharacterized protein n=1 Tax=Hymenobacter metallilatus TaxID=2493666 RepID=A0A428J0P8_9BACT|nr:hypothetical protein [Hymenobacter metallilatus]RSK25278.1 hypothetical protein EI290_17820 [Hymenobacter metallilatus]
MKKVFACLVFVAMVVASSGAQASPGDGSKLSARATDMTRRIAERTRLTEGQYVKVRALNVRLLTEMADLRKQFANDAAELDKAMADVQMRYEWDLAAVLGPKRMTAYEEMKTNFTATNLR